MTIPYRTVGINRSGEVNILNIKCDPITMGSFRGKPGFRAAYHMNKDKWITILLDGSAEREDIIFLLDLSYSMTASRITKKRAT